MLTRTESTITAELEAVPSLVLPASLWKSVSVVGKAESVSVVGTCVAVPLLIEVHLDCGEPVLRFQLVSGMPMAFVTTPHQGL